MYNLSHPARTGAKNDEIACETRSIQVVERFSTRMLRACFKPPRPKSIVFFSRLKVLPRGHLTRDHWPWHCHCGNATAFPPDGLNVPSSHTLRWLSKHFDRETYLQSPPSPTSPHCPPRRCCRRSILRVAHPIPHLCEMHTPLALPKLSQSPHLPSS